MAGAVEQRRIVVHGRVQGVGFRFWARDLAASMRLRGTVRNMPGGRTVEAVVQGQPDLVERFETALQRGPSGAVVESVESAGEPVDPRLPEFTIVT